MSKSWLQRSSGEFGREDRRYSFFVVADVCGVV